VCFWLPVFISYWLQNARNVVSDNLIFNISQGCMPLDPLRHSFSPSPRWITPYHIKKKKTPTGLYHDHVSRDFGLYDTSPWCPKTRRKEEKCWLVCQKSLSKNNNASTRNMQLTNWKYLFLSPWYSPKISRTGLENGWVTISVAVSCAVQLRWPCWPLLGGSWRPHLSFNQNWVASSLYFEENLKIFWEFLG